MVHTVSPLYNYTNGHISSTAFTQSCRIRTRVDHTICSTGDGAKNAVWHKSRRAQCCYSSSNGNARVSKSGSLFPVRPKHYDTFQSIQEGMCPPYIQNLIRRLAGSGQIEGARARLRSRGICELCD